MCRTSQLKQTNSTELGPRESLESKLKTPHLAQSVTQPLSSDHLSRYYSENISTLPSLTLPIQKAGNVLIGTDLVGVGVHTSTLI